MCYRPIYDCGLSAMFECMDILRPLMLDSLISKQTWLRKSCPKATTKETNESQIELVTDELLYVLDHIVQQNSFWKT